MEDWLQRQMWPDHGTVKSRLAKNLQDRRRIYENARVVNRNELFVFLPLIFYFFPLPCPFNACLSSQHENVRGVG